MIWPDWQYPHCGTSSASHARCTGWLLSGERPSIVVTFAPSREPIGNEHERIGLPSI
jgi:hypothetical protein